MVEASAQATQRVCGAACRALRDRKLARARRRRDLDDARADERERKRASRARRRAASGCDAPASDPECLLSRAQVSELVDRVLARSRAILVRDFQGALCGYVARSGPRNAAVAPDSPDAQAASREQAA